MTPKQEVALRLALDALDEFCELGAIIRPLEVRDALREALAEQPANVAAVNTPSERVDKQAQNVHMQPAQQCRREIQSDGNFVCDCKPKECLHLEQIKATAEDLAKLGWQSIQCPFCGWSGAQAFPKPWVGLTDGQLNDLYATHHDKFGQPISADHNGWGYERAIEAKLRELNEHKEKNA